MSTATSERGAGSRPAWAAGGAGSAGGPTRSTSGRRAPEWQPPVGPSRAAGGLLGVAGGESFTARATDDPSLVTASPGAGPGTDVLGHLDTPDRPARPHPAGPRATSGPRPAGAGAAVGAGHGPGVGAPEPDGPVTRALVELAATYVRRRGHGVPVDVAERHEGVATPAWLLAVAVVRSNSRELIADTLELASAAGVPSRSLGDCVAYVELAAGLFAGRPAEAAIRAATRDGRRPRPAPVASSPHPPLCGEGTVDALTASLWALVQPGGITDVLPALAAITTPGVGAAVAGLLGLRDGCASMPATWQRRLRSAPDCLALAPGLVRARCRGHQLHRQHDTPGSPCVHGVVAGAR
ncbi:MAG TPA: hypothetical protein VIL36_00225 [Acidimicrobiales bacterium]